MYTVTLTVVSVHGAAAVYAVSIGVKLKGIVTPGGVTNPETFTYATIGEPQSLDPAWDYESAGGQVIQNIYETLVYYDGASAENLVPVLATEVPSLANGLLSSDGLHYTFNLRTDVKFHDGSSMTVDDVIYSIERAMLMNDAEGAAWMLGQIMLPGYSGLGSKVNWDDVNASMTRVDSDTLTFNLITPYPAFLFIMAYSIGSVVSKNFVETHGGIVPNEKNDYMNRHEMGTGPFYLKEWAPNQYVKLQRYEDYWGGAANLNFVVIKKVQDLGTRKMLLFNGQADAIYVPVMFKSDVENKENVFTQDMLPTFSLTFFGFNQDIVEGPTLEVGDVPTTFFADLNVRQAFTHAFDYNKYLEVATKNTAIQPTGPIPQGMFGYDPDVPLVLFDLAASADYLNKALDTRTADPLDTYADNGFTIWLYYNAGNLGRQTGCEILKTNLERLSQNASAGVTGTITVNVQALDWPTYLDARADRWLPVFFLGWNVDYPDPDDFANPFCHQNGSFPIYLGLRNQSLTTLVEHAAIELNTDVRKQMYSDIAWSCYENAYYIYASQPTGFAVLRTWVQGWEYNPTNSDMPTLFYPLSKSLT
jgi:peptide/nickel transport system substrate-binding protein